MGNKYNFFNIFVNSHIDTKNLYFKCVFDSHTAKKIDNIDALTHIAEK